MPNMAARLRGQIEAEHPGAVVERRTASGIVMLRPDRKTEHRYSTGPMHWRQNPADEWREINTDLIDCTVAPYTHQVADAPYATLVGPGGRRRFYPRRWVTDEYVDFGPMQQKTGATWDALSVAAVHANQNAAIFNTANTELRVGFHGRGGRSIITVRNAGGAKPLRWQIDLTGLSFEGGEFVSLRDGKTVAWMRPPFWTDQAGDLQQHPIPWKMAGGYIELTPDLDRAKYPVTIDPDYSITAGADDGDADEDDTIDASDTAIGLGTLGAGTNRYNGWFVFQDISAASGATVTAATILFHAVTGGHNAVTVETAIYCIDEDTSPAPSTWSAWNTDHGLHDGETKTDWDFTATSTAGTELTTADFKSHVQHVFARSGWTTGNDLQVHIDNDGSTANRVQAVASYESTTQPEPVLSLTIQSTINHTLDTATRTKTAADFSFAKIVTLDTATRTRTAADLTASWRVTLDTATRTRAAADALTRKVVDVQPGDNLQTEATAAAEYTYFRMAAGVYHAQSVQPKHGQAWVSEDGGAILDGDGTATYAFSGISGGTGGQYVMLRGLTIRNYAPPDRDSVVRPYGNAYYWLVEDCDIGPNAEMNIRVDEGWVVKDCYIHHAGKMGLNGSGAAHIYDNEIAFNNTTESDWGYEAGASKFTYSVGMRIHDNYWHDDHGNGIWFDGSNEDTVIQDNLIVNEVGAGIFYEVSDGPCVIKGNTVRHCGFLNTGWLNGSGILVANSEDVEVTQNLVEWCYDGIGGIHATRADPQDLKNLNVHHNTIRMAEGQGGIATNTEDPVFTEWGNTFDYNTYIISSTMPSTWMYGSPYNSTWAQWQALGFDVNSTLTVALIKMADTATRARTTEDFSFTKIATIDTATRTRSAQEITPTWIVHLDAATRSRVADEIASSLVLRATLDTAIRIRTAFDLIVNSGQAWMLWDD